MLLSLPYLYNTPVRIIGACDFICDIYLAIHPPYVLDKYLAGMAYISTLVDTFVPHTYLALTCEVDVTVGYVLAYICKNVGCKCPFNIITV